MLADAADGSIEVVVAWHLDRLARRVVDLEELIDRSTREGWRIATVNGDLDLSNDSGRLVGRILASVASAEVERKGARQARARLQAATAGRPAGGWRAFGYDDDGTTIRRDEGRLLRAAYTRLLAGGSLRGIAVEWNAAGLPTTKGGRWTGSSVGDVLRRARYAGLSTYRGEIVGQGTWRGIVDEATWRAARAILDDPARRTTPDTRRRYMLSGLATCGRCGALVDTGRTQHGQRTYKCSALRQLARGAEIIDEYVTRVIVGRLSRPDAVDLLVETDRPDVDALREQAQVLRSRLEEIAALFADGEVTASQLSSGSTRLRAQLADIEGRMTDSIKVASLGGLVGASDVGKAWDGLDVDRRRRVIDTLATITLESPGRGNRTFDPETIKIVWRA